MKKAKRPEPPAPPLAIEQADPPRWKALSVRQPWAEEILAGRKRVEFRRVPTNLRATIYLYASRTLTEDDYEAAYRAELHGYQMEELPRGLVVGVVDICGCRDLEDGSFGWDLANPRRLLTPLPPWERPQPVWFHPFGRPE